MNSYMMIDEHNPKKAHHITINDEGEVFYNQAIHSDHLAERKQGIEGHEGWYDFYEPTLVNMQGWHGYMKYIKRAYRRWNQYDRPLVQGDTFMHWFNQAEREVEVLTVIGTEALGWYQMPAGRVFLCIHDVNSKWHKRTQSFKTLPRKWASQIDADELQWLKQQNQ